MSQNGYGLVVKTPSKLEVAAAAARTPRKSQKGRRAVATKERPVAKAAQACSDSNRRAQGIPHLVFLVSIGIKFRQEYRTKIPLAQGARR